MFFPLSLSSCHLSCAATYCSARREIKRGEMFSFVRRKPWVNDRSAASASGLGVEVFCSVTLGVPEKSAEICNRTHFPGVTFMCLASSVLSPNLFFHIFPPCFFSPVSLQFFLFILFKLLRSTPSLLLLFISFSLSQPGWAVCQRIT